MTVSATQALNKCQDRREQVIQAAAEVFLKNGYQHASMEAISCEAGVAKQTLYNYFGNKEALFAATVTQLCQHKQQQMLIASQRDDIEHTLRVYAERLLDDLRSPKTRALFKMMVSEAIHFPRLGRLFFEVGIQRDIDILREFIERQCQAGRINASHPEQAALFFHGALNAYFRPKSMMLGEALDAENLNPYIDYCIKQFMQLHAAQSDTSNTKRP